MVKSKLKVKKSAPKKSPAIPASPSAGKNVLTYVAPKKGTGVVNSDNIITADK